jgi:putative FmdB family regulatory protein
MPTYLYECSSCKKKKELFQKISEKEAPACDKCGEIMTQTLGKCNFVLKGKGWGKDGYQ